MIGISIGISLRSSTVSPVVVPPMFYVDPAGNDALDGTTPATAWATLTKVMATTFTAGSQINLKGGATFSGQLTLTAGQHFGTAGKVTKFTSYGTGRAKIVASVAANHGVYALNPQYVTVDNLELQGFSNTSGGGTGSGIWFENNTSGNVKLAGVSITNNLVHDYGNNGIAVWGNPADASGSGFTGTVITGNKVYSCTKNAVTFQGCGITLQSLSTFGLAAKPATIINAYVANNEVYNCDGKSYSVINSHSANGVLIGQGFGCLIEKNYIHDNGLLSGGGYGAWYYDTESSIIQFNESAFNKVEAGRPDGGGFDIDGGCKNCIIQFNYSHDNYGSGYLLYTYVGGVASGQYPLTGNIIRYNISENDGAGDVTKGGGIMIGCGETSGVHNNNAIYNNVVFQNYANAVSLMWTDTQSQRITDSYIANNIFINMGTGGKLVGSTSTTVPSSTTRMLSNMYYAPNGVAIKWGGPTYTTISDWRAANVTQETISGANTAIAADPLMVGTLPVGTTGGFNSALLGAYKTQTGSPARNAGIDLNALFGIPISSVDLYASAAPVSLFDIGVSESSSTSPAVDVTPNQFTFTDVTGATTSTDYTSNTITVAGISGATPISVSSGSYSKNAGAFTSVSGTVVNGDTVAVKATSASSGGSTVNVALTIGSVSDTYSVTTASSGATFVDTFDRADENLEVSANWTKVTGATTGAAKVVSNQLATTTTVENAYVSPDMGSANHYVEYNGAAPGSAGPFICCRMTDGNNFVGIRSSTTAYQVWKRIAGSLTQLNTIPGTPTAGDTVRMEIVGDNYATYLNGTASVSGAIGGDVPSVTRQGIAVRTQIRNPWIDNYKTGAL